MKARTEKTKNRRSSEGAEPDTRGACAPRGQAEPGTSMGNGVREYWSIGGEGCRNRRVRLASAELCGKNQGFFRDVSRFSTLFRTEQARNSAIFALFRVRPIFNKEARNGRNQERKRKKS